VSFEVTVTDQNVSDYLYVRWIIDYPPYSTSSGLFVPDVVIAPSADGLPLQSTQSIPISCLSALPHEQLHPLMALVADRPFSTDSSLSREALLTALTATAPDGKKAEAHWIVNLTTCPSQ
jgi:hypothetical protein